MSYQECQENWKNFSELITKLSTTQHEQLTSLINRCIEQNITIMNDIFSISLDNLKKLEKAKTANDIICMQARFTHEISQKLSLSAQRFLAQSLANVSDYNEWLKAHCDLATD